MEFLYAFLLNCLRRYCFPFGRPEGALKATLSLLERVKFTLPITENAPRKKNLNSFNESGVNIRMKDTNMNKVFI